MTDVARPPAEFPSGECITLLLCPAPQNQLLRTLRSRSSHDEK